MELQGALEQKLDYRSIKNRLSEIGDFYYYCGKSDYMDYADLLAELANLASFLDNDLERLVQDFDYSDRLPYKIRVHCDVKGYRGATWFDAAAALLDETDMNVMLEMEGLYDSESVEEEKDRRRRRVMALTKESQFYLLTEVLNFLLRFIKLNSAFQMVCGMMDELGRGKS